MPTLARALSLLLAGAVLAGPARAGDAKAYRADFEFIADTVAAKSASVRTKKLDWKAITARYEPRFARAASDAEHVRNIVELLACVEDSHTDVTRTTVPWSELPSKGQGMFGAGLGFAEECGKFVVSGHVPRHSLESQVPRGAVLTAVGGLPAWYAMGRARARMAAAHGVSSDHSLWASMFNRLLPFGEAQSIEASFLLPDGKERSLTLPRWGPGGKSFSMYDAELPEGISPADGATSGFLEVPFGARVGYLRITGGMDAETEALFHAAFDRLKGMELLLLDGRAMGGGGDDFAWRMAGRLFERAVQNGAQRRLEPTGDWQFGGPVVFLQDALMVSSAETFTWAISETGRAITVGQATGGWGIIPATFDCPSGLATFRLGVNARATPIRGVQTEGVGWPADVRIPRGPEFLAELDPARSVALALLEVLHAGVAVEDARENFAKLFEGDVPAFGAFAARIAKKAPRFDGARLAKLVRADIEAEIAMERALLDLEDLPLDAAGTLRRLERIAARAKAADLGSRAAALEKDCKALAAEEKAQRELLALADGDAAARKSFLARHGKTRTARFARATLWK